MNLAPSHHLEDCFATTELACTIGVEREETPHVAQESWMQSKVVISLTLGHINELLTAAAACINERVFAHFLAWSNTEDVTVLGKSVAIKEHLLCWNWLRHVGIGAEIFGCGNSVTVKVTGTCAQTIAMRKMRINCRLTDCKITKVAWVSRREVTDRYLCLRAAGTGTAGSRAC